MDPISMIAPVISNKATVYGVVGALTAWAAISLVSLWLKTRKLTRSLEHARILLAQASGPREFSAQYEAINPELERDAVLGGRWREFRESLLIPSDSHQLIRTTTRPSYWFNLDLVRTRAIRLDLRYHAAMPNLLVGAGLLFTFLGLTIALSSASGVVSGEASARSEALRLLLGAASFKFLTSLAGLLLSIVYALLRKSRLRRVEASLDGFVADLETRTPLLTPVALQQQQLALMEQQSTHLETFSNDLAVALGSAFDQSFNDRLAEHIGPLTDAMQLLSNSMSTRNDETMQSMLENFLRRLDGGTTDHMGDVVKTLANLGTKLEHLESSLGNAAVRMAESADTMAERMGEGAEAALARITDQMGGLAESLRGLAEQTRGAGAEAGDAMAERITQAARGFEAAAQTVASTLADAASSMERRMGEQASASSERMNKQMETMLGEMRALSEESRGAGTYAFKALAEEVASAAAGFQATSAQVAASLEKAATDTGGAFGQGAEVAVAHVAAATEAMRNEMRTTLADFTKTLGQAGSALSDGSQASAEAMRTTLDGAAQRLADSLKAASEQLTIAGGNAGQSLQRGGTEASERVTGAGARFGEQADRLANQVGAITAAGDTLAQRITSFQNAADNAAQPLVASAGDLRLAGESARNASTALLTASQTLARAIEQVSSVAQRLTIASDAASQLTTNLDEATQRFAGVDRSLADTLDGLQTGLKAFTSEITEFVSQTDTNLAKAATQLAQLVNSLEDTLEDYAPPSNAGRR